MTREKQLYNLKTKEIMKKTLFSIALLLLAGGVSGQDKVVKKARTLLEESKETQKDGGVILNLEKLKEAQETLKPALTSGTTKDMATAWDLQGDIYQLLFGEELNKAAVKMPLDTLAFAETWWLVWTPMKNATKRIPNNSIRQKTRGI